MPMSCDHVTIRRTLLRCRGAGAYRRVLGWYLLGTLLLAGCDGGGDELQRFRVTGKVTFRGEPVPKGTVLFRPDTGQGNAGPGTSAEIVDGYYETMAEQGIVGGPHIVDVMGYDGIPYEDGPQVNPMGRPLFSDVQFRAELPRSETEYDITLP